MIRDHCGYNKLMNPSQLIDKQISDFPDWRGKTLSKLRSLIKETDPEIQEEWRWSTAVYVHNGMVCALGAFKDHVKINFFNGVNLKDSDNLFNSGQNSKLHRGIDFYEGDEIKEESLKRLIKASVEYNTSRFK